MRYLTPWDAYRVQKKSFKEELEELQKAHGALVLDRCLDVVKAHFAKCAPGDMRDLLSDVIDEMETVNVEVEP